MTTAKRTAAPRTDAVGALAYVVYILVGGFLAFGFAWSIRGAIATQNESVCRAMLPELRSVVRGTVSVADALSEGASVSAGDDVLAKATTDAEGKFELMLPEGSHELVIVPQGRKPYRETLVVGPAQLIEVAITIANDDRAGVVQELSRGPWMAPELEVEDLDGNPLKLSDFRGRFVVLNFWATWCEPCTKEWPQLHQLALRLSERDDVVVLAVSIDNEREAIVPFLERMALDHTEVGVVWDSTQSQHVPYGSRKIPDTFFIDESGRVISVFVNVRKWGQPEAFHCVAGSIGRG